MPLSIVITDEEINEVAKALGCDFDEKRREALRCVESLDIQSCPGSGKTTLLIVKLALLSRKWNWRDQGICVLSHTNVAREEIEKRLSLHTYAHKLLTYPHFIGTIQAFINQFLAIPYLRSIGFEDTPRIDDLLFKKEIGRLLSYDYKLNSHVNRSSTLPAIVEGLRYEGATLALGSSATRGKLPGEHTSTYKKFVALKKQLTVNGFFKYDDMYAFAEAYIRENPVLIDLIRIRFPWVFIDEMQDTDDTQDSLLGVLFRDKCVLQRLGDINQAIYVIGREVTLQKTFPKSGFLEIPESKRFGPQIATLASPLTAVCTETLIGRSGSEEKRNTIFLFDEKSIEAVLPNFGNLLLKEFTGELSRNFVAKAIGFRKEIRDTGTSTDIPFNISDYWPNFNPAITSMSSSLICMLDYVKRARHLVKGTGECQTAYATIIDSLLIFLLKQDTKCADGKRFTKTHLKEVMENNKSEDSFNSLLSELCLSAESMCKEYWETSTQTVLELLEPLFGGALTPAATEFIKWPETMSQEEEGGAITSGDLVNTYRHEKDGQCVNIEIDTIHGVKGETHNATLVLETKYHTHDLKSLLPFIKGIGDRAALNYQQKERMKRIFVGMTRPRELLCLAIHKRHLAEGDIEQLSSIGWHIVDLTQPQK